MALTKPKLKADEAFFPIDKSRGRMIQLHELKERGRTLVDVNQYKAVREAQKRGGFVLSLAEDWEAFLYARDHQEDPKLERFYDSVTSNVKYARWTRTQVHNLRSNCPLVVNIAEVHPSHDLPIRYEKEFIEVPWLPREEGYIQELDRRTGLPRKLGSDPNPKFHNTYFFIALGLDVAAAIRGRDSELGLYLDWEPFVEYVRPGVRLAKNFPLEKRV